MCVFLTRGGVCYVWRVLHHHPRAGRKVVGGGLRGNAGRCIVRTHNRVVNLAALHPRFNEVGGLEIFPNQGSGVLTSTVWADGLIDNPPLQAIRRGDRVAFLPMEGLL
jgi:molybdopterin biosynthesis enzyme